MIVSDVQKWIEQSGYSKQLGVGVEEISAETATLVIPFREGNSNPGGALHGGVYASLSVITAQAIARTALGNEVGPFHTAGFQINYLAAAINESVSASARLLRRGKELCFIEVTVSSESGRDVSHATLMIRGRQGAQTLPGPLGRMAIEGDDPGKMGPAITGMVPFIHERGIVIGATLGRVLFFDKRLSKNDTIACASCHLQKKAFADPRRFSLGFNGGKTGRNSMSLGNGRFTIINGSSPGFFWDERAATLEDQALMPIQDKIEMGMNLKDLEQKLQRLPYYPPLFAGRVSLKRKVTSDADCQSGCAVYAVDGCV